MRATAVKAKGAAAAKPLKERVKGTLVPPEFTVKLMEHVGPTAAAKAIGTTPGTLHKARNAGMISMPLEVAAKGIWREQGYADMEAAQSAPAAPRTSNLGEAVHAPTADGTVLMLVQVPRGREALVQKTVEAIGGTVAVQA
jgi:hypothetical protein